ncbi:MAG: glutathione S-transferase family protein [Rhizobiaceae bacterium]
MRLYTISASLYCAKLRILLRHKRLEWEEIPPPGGYGSEEYKRIVPAGNLPALEHDGWLLSDSEAIAEYLNETFPEPDMLPGDIRERARIRELSRFHDTRLEPALRALFPHIAIENRDTDFVLRQWFVLQERLLQAEPLLSQVHEPLTLGDCGFPVSCLWIEVLTSRFEMKPVLSDTMKAYLAAVSKHSAVAAELTDYRLHLTNWLASK